MERICGNCRLFDPKSKRCNIVVLCEGKRYKIPVDAGDYCFFEENYFDSKKQECFAEEIKEVKFWVENANGEKTDGNGTVKIEYPEGFFGD